MGSKKILTVDDEVKNLTLLEAILTPLGYEVETAQSGKEALAKVEASPPDMILLDVMMPEMTGYELCKRLKAEESTQIIPIVMITALVDKESRVRGIEAGADDFLTKPVDKIELTARVKNLIKVKEYNDSIKDWSRMLQDKVIEQTAMLRQSFEQLQGAHANLEKAHLDTLIRLSVAAEYKDEDTANHIHRMSAYARIVAENMGLSEDQVRLIVHASPMHDVGKIGIPDHILLKPGKLTPEEWSIMKSHTLIGERILADADDDFTKAGRVIALSHHEKWDGSGYPKGLKGEDIPLLGRITAIADVFDALTSKRPYKAPMSNEKAFGIIEKSVGNHFDPGVGKAFFGGIDKILFNQKQHTDMNLSQRQSDNAYANEEKGDSYASK